MRCASDKKLAQVCGVKGPEGLHARAKEVYRASTKALAEQKLKELGDAWGKKYPVVIKSWNTNWERLSQYFKYPEDIRRIIYTTNIVEGFHRQIRKVTKTKGRSPATPPS